MLVAFVNKSTCYQIVTGFKAIKGEIWTIKCLDFEW